MGKRNINITNYANTITECLKEGVFLTTKADGIINSMVIGWGHIGRIWERPVFIAYVRDCRYTFEMLEKNPEFTVNIPINGFDENAFVICGTKSGREMDKISEAGLTTEDPVEISVPGLREFPLTLECRVIYTEKQCSSKLPKDIQNQFYSIEPSEHTAFYGEIVAAYMIE